jgi:hypothetical protein
MLLLMESPRTFPKSRAHESPRAPGEHHRGSGPPSFPGNFAHERLSRTPKTNGDSRSQGAFRVATSGRNIRLGIDQGQASSPGVQSFGQEPWPGSNCSPQEGALFSSPTHRIHSQRGTNLNDDPVLGAMFEGAPYGEQAIRTDAFRLIDL